MPKGRSGELGLQPPSSCCLGRKVSVGSPGRGQGSAAAPGAYGPAGQTPSPELAGPAEEGRGQGLPLQIWLYLPHTLKPSGLALRAARLAPSARDTELSSKPDLPSSRSLLGGRGAESAALEPIPELFNYLSPLLLSSLKYP